MKKKNIYSRLVPLTVNWGSSFKKGEIISLLQRCVELDATSFLLNDLSGTVSSVDRFGTALSESGLSRDKIQLIGIYSGDRPLQEEIDEILLKSHSDYLDLLFVKADLLQEDLVQELKSQLSRGNVVEVGSIGAGFPRKNSGSPELAANLVEWSQNSGRKVLQNQAPKEMDKFVWLKEDTNIIQGPDINKLESKYVVTFRQLLTGWLLNHPAHLHIILSEEDKRQIPATADIQNINFEKQDLSLLTKKLEQT